MPGNMDLDQTELRNLFEEYMGKNDSSDSSTYPFIQISSGTGADTFGSWVEIIDDVGNVAVTILEALVKSTVALLEQFEIEIGVGAAASETKITEISGETELLQLVPLPVRKRVAKNSRIAMRVRDKSVTAVNYKVALKIN